MKELQSRRPDNVQEVSFDAYWMSASSTSQRRAIHCLLACPSREKGWSLCDLCGDAAMIFGKKAGRGGELSVICVSYAEKRNDDQ